MPHLSYIKKQRNSNAGVNVIMDNRNAITDGAYMSEKRSAGKKSGSLIFQFALKQGLLVLALFIVLGTFSVAVVSKGTNGSYRETMEGMMPVFADSVHLWTQQFVHEVHMYTEADIVKTGSEDQIAAWLRHTIAARRFQQLLFCGPEGIAALGLGADVDISDRDYFKLS